MNKKGFTLIELLAVIVILAAIALILTPVVTGIIEQSKKKAEESSALYYIDAVEKYMILHDLNSEKYPYKLEQGKTYYVVEDSSFAYNNKFSLIGKIYAEEETTNIYLSDFIEVKGEAPIDGYVVIGEKNKVASASFGIKKYEVNCDNSSCEATGKFDSSIIRVNSITIDSIENTTIKPDETLQLSATVLPNNATDKTITWISSDETVATVDENGLVTGVSEGTVTITAKAGSKTSNMEIKVETPNYISYSAGTKVTTKDGTSWLVVENSDETTSTIKIMSVKAIKNSLTTSMVGEDIFTTSEANYKMQYSQSCNNSIGWDNSDIKIYLEQTVKPILQNSVGARITNITIWGIEELEALGCTVKDTTSNYIYSIDCQSSLAWYTDAFRTVDSWTKIGCRAYTDRLFVSFHNGTFTDVQACVSYGVRPVITISKSAIE